MKRNLARSLVMILFLFFVQGIVLAHHGTAAYDMEKVVTLKGVVTSYDFVNPHAEIHVAVTDEKGQTVDWLAETNNPNRLVRRGWTSKTLKPGDVITVEGNRAKSGTNNLRLTKVVLSDGTVLDPL